MLGLVNNLTFTPENVLLKSIPQNINGNVYISNKSLKELRILPLSFVKAKFESINGKMLIDFYGNIVYKNDPLSSIGTRLEFNELLTVDYMQFYADYNGFKLNNLIDQFHLYQVVTNYSKHLEYVNVVGNAIVEELKSTFDVQQTTFNERL